MKKTLQIVFYCFLNFSVIGQTSKSYEIVNEVIPTLIDSQFSYFKLCAEAIRPRNTDILQNELTEHLTPRQIQEILDKIEKAEKTVNWQKKEIKNAVILNHKEKYSQYDKISKDWTKATEKFRKYLGLNKSEFDKFLTNPGWTPTDKVIADFLKMRIEEQQVFYIGQPIIDKDEEFIVLEFGNGRGSTSASGYTCLFKRIEGKWILIKKINSWVS